ncbi:MAG TPA: SIR2 family protein [Thermoanaerobaculia bacterium]
MSEARAPRKRREKREVGRSLVNRSDLDGLRRAWAEKDLVLFLGAGVSKPYGIPTWKDLVLEILFDQTDVARRLEPVDLPFRRALAAWLVDYYDYDPIILARVVKNEIRRRASRSSGSQNDAHALFLEKVREHLYPKEPPVPHEPTTLTAVADFIKRSGDGSGISAVVSFNYDDLLERKLAGSFDFRPVWSARRSRSKALPILHPHGFLPQEGDSSECRLVFTEDDYHGLTATVFHWALTAVVHYLRHNTVLFIGLSMLDPNLRRLLDASYVFGDIPAHWQVQMRHKISRTEMRTVRRDIRDRARRFRREMELGPAEQIPELQEAVLSVLEQADSYDRNLFEAMGVKTIWVESYDDIPALLERISAG